MQTKLILSFFLLHHTRRAATKRMSVKESSFQKHLLSRLRALLPGCVVLKNDPTYIQGFPDLLVLYGDRWIALECKRSATASHQPNQDFYIQKLGEMSFARFVYPENEEEVLDEIQQAFQPDRSALIFVAE